MLIIIFWELAGAIRLRFVLLPLPVFYVRVPILVPRLLLIRRLQLTKPYYCLGEPFLVCSVLRQYGLGPPRLLYLLPKLRFLCWVVLELLRLLL